MTHGVYKVTIMRQLADRHVACFAVNSHNKIVPVYHMKECMGM